MIKIGISLAALACAAFAQEDATMVKLHAEALASKITTAKFGLIGPTVKNAPYSAEGSTETIQTLADGTHINRKDTYTIYRDSEGRVRREDGDQVWISDPVANVSYIVDSKARTARKLGLSRTITLKTDSLAKIKSDVWTASVKSSGPQPKMEEDNTESLGTQNMEGVEVEGSRTTTVIPQGQIGNDRPLQMVHERWECAELQVTVLSKNADPMLGETTERLTNIRRGEPDPTLFQTPAGSYRMEIDK